MIWCFLHFGTIKSSTITKLIKYGLISGFLLLFGYLLYHYLIVHSPKDSYERCIPATAGAVTYFKKPSLMKAHLKKILDVDLNLKNSESPGLITVHLVKEDSIDCLVVLPSSALELFKDDFRFSYEFEGRKVYEMSFEKGKKRLYIAYIKDLVLISPFAFLVEAGIDAYTDKNKRLKIDRALRGELKDNEVIQYANIENLSILTSSVLRPEANQQLLPWLQLLGQTVAFSNAGTEEGTLWKGQIQVDEKRAEKLKLAGRKLENPPPGENPALQIPESTCLYLAFRRWPKEEKSKLIESLSQTYFEPWLGLHSGLLMTTPLSAERIGDHQFLFFECADVDSASVLMNRFAEKMGTLKVYNYQGFEIIQLITGNFFQKLTGWPLLFPNTTYLTIIGNYVVFAASEFRLKMWIDKYIAGATRAMEATNQIMNNDKNSVGFEGYLNFNNAHFLKSTFLKDESSLVRKLPRKGVLKMRCLFFDGKWDFELTSIEESPERSNSMNWLWKKEFEGTIRIPPLSYWSEKTKRWYIFIQDELGLHCLAPDGYKNWELPLKDSIFSELMIIPDEKGEEVLCFSTKKEIYILSLNGALRNRSPWTLPSEASNAVEVVVRSGQLTGFLQACMHEGIYFLNLGGVSRSPWNPQSGFGVFHHPLVHIQTQQADQIFGLNNEGNLYIWSLDGTLLFDSLIPDKKPFVIYVQNDVQTPSIWIGTGSGKLLKKTIDGGIEQVNLSNAEHPIIDFNGFRDKLLVLTNKELSLFDTLGEKMENWKSYPNNASYDEVKVHHLLSNGQMYISLFSKKEKKVTLLDANGTELPGYPIDATQPPTIMDVEGDGRFEIILFFGKTGYAVMRGTGNG